jgi:asparagine synthase (glutamine-hydrolysing)
LRGPFAVAIFDRRTRKLTLARDHLGFNVVVWHKCREFFAFSTMPRGLFALPDVPRELNTEKMADFIVLNHADHRTTMFRGVNRVPPAHVMSIGFDGSVSEKCYWRVTDAKPVRLSSDQAYAEGLRDCLDRAVRRQLRSSHAVGAYLSGGLDSSAVAALASRALGEKGKRLSTYTQLPREGFSAPAPRGRYNDEKPYVDEIGEMLGNLDVNYVRNDRCDDFADLERFFLVLEGPVRNPTNMGWMLAIPRLAREQGRRVLLSGGFGNYTISWIGWSQPIEHLLKGRLITACRQWWQYYLRSSNSAFTVLRKLFIDPLVPERLSDKARAFGRGGKTPWAEHSAIRPDFAAEIDVKERARRAGHDFYYRTYRNEREYGLKNVDYLGDWHTAIKAFTGVEIRDPTADIDVVEYCFGVPVEQYLVEQIDRSLIRRAMWGMLPASVLTNRFNGLQSSDWFEKLEAQRGQHAQEIANLRSFPLARRMLDLDRLENAIRDWPKDDRWHTRRTYNEYALALTRGISAGRFLRWIEASNRTSNNRTD